VTGLTLVHHVGERYCVIVAVVHGGAADAANIHPGDMILSINGDSTAGLTDTETVAALSLECADGLVNSYIYIYIYIYISFANLAGPPSLSQLRSCWAHYLPPFRAVSFVSVEPMIGYVFERALPCLFRPSIRALMSVFQPDICTFSANIRTFLRIRVLTTAPNQIIMTTAGKSDHSEYWHGSVELPF
jgi:hypothetical protein